MAKAYLSWTTYTFFTEGSDEENAAEDGGGVPCNELLTDWRLFALLRHVEQLWAALIKAGVLFRWRGLFREAGSLTETPITWDPRAAGSQCRPSSSLRGLFLGYI